MESIRTRPTISAYSPEQTCQRIAKALNHAEDVIKEVNNFEKNSLVSSINEFAKVQKWGNIYADEENVNKEFAEKTLKQLVKMVLDADQSEIKLFETEEKAYVLQKNKGKISFSVLNYPTKYSITDMRFLRSAECENAKEILCEIDIPELQRNIEIYLKNKSLDADSPFFSLLNSNPKLLEFAGEYVIEKPLQYQHLFKHVQIKKREEEFSRLEFSQNRLRALSGGNFLERVKSFERGHSDDLSPNVCDFICFGKKPGPYKASQVFWGYFKITLEKMSQHSGGSGWPLKELPYYQNILQDIVWLDFAFLNFDHDEKLNFFQPLCLFLREHFEGNSLAFGKLKFGHLDNATKDNCAKAFFDLIKHNPNLRSIGLNDGEIIVDYLPTFVEVFNSNAAITKLRLNGSGFSDRDRLEALTVFLANNSTLRILELCDFQSEMLIVLVEALRVNKTLITLIVDNARVTLSAMKALIHASKSLTSLQFPDSQLIESGDYFEEKDGALVAILKENKTITSFEFPWYGGYPLEFTQHMERNQSRVNLKKALLVSSLSDQNNEQLPQDVTKLISSVWWALIGTKQQQLLKDYLEHH